MSCTFRGNSVPGVVVSLRFATVCVSLVLLSVPAFGAAGAEGRGAIDAGPGSGKDDGGSAADAGADGNAAAASKDSSPQVSKLRQRARQIRALLQGELDVSVEPSTLFELSLDDGVAVRVEIERLRAIVSAADSAAADAGLLPDAGASTDAAGNVVEPGVGDGGLPAAGAGPAGVLEDLDEQRWSAQLALDRATLAFLSLPAPQRQALLGVHAQRQKADAQSKAKRALTQAEQKAQQAELKRKLALMEAKKARTEAARLIAEEQAKLLEVARKQAEFEADLVRREQALSEQTEQALALARRVRDAIEAAVEEPEAERDRLYEVVRDRLRVYREKLAVATVAFGSGRSSAPEAPPDALGKLPAELDTREVEKLRGEVEAYTRKLAFLERALFKRQASSLYEHVQLLNQERLNLLSHLSSQKRSAVTSFAPAGLDQALAEVRQVWLVLEYHVVATWRWIISLRDADATRGRAALGATLIVLRLVLPILLFVWWRRHAEDTLQSLRDSIRETQRVNVAGHKGGLALRTVNLLSHAHRPLEWLLLLSAVVWLLPPETQELLEVSLLTSIFTWVLGGSLIVLVLDFLAGEDSQRRWRKSRLQTAHIRLRSLKLVGRIVVAVGLILSVTRQLVGKGTIYGWVLGLCWLFAFPAFLLIVKWYRAVIFERIELSRRKSKLKDWVISKKQGWQSFLAAMVGALLLLGSGAARFLRAWISTFELSRRVLAYLFRREISKKAETHKLARFSRLPSDSYRLLGPDTVSEKLVPSVADGQVDDIVKRIKAPGGGVFAIVGERGLGKTTILTRIARDATHVTLVDCPHGGMEKFAPAFVKALGAAQDALLETVAKDYDEEQERESGILVDNAHRLILPMMGGFKSFDRVLSIARGHSRNVAWVFAFDEVIWRLFERMRGARPIFDDVIRLKPWGEEAIARLVVERSQMAKVRPEFDHLLDELPRDADEIDREEALSRTEAGYYRLIWDYAGGNPGVALHTWRALLGLDSHGVPRVKIFEAPRTDDLEDLPDSAVFVLRALVQLERAEPEALSRATGIRVSDVEDALRFGSVRGYFGHSRQGYFVKWSWFRVITRFLQRRHLLSG